jgi:pimeloyl-ACP methyl ester carboxylesterase
MIAVRNYYIEPERFRHMALPICILQGEDTTDAMKKATGSLSDAIPGTETIILPGEGHVAMLSAPDKLASEIVHFFGGVGRT